MQQLPIIRQRSRNTKGELGMSATARTHPREQFACTLTAVTLGALNAEQKAGLTT